MATETIEERLARCSSWPERFPREQWEVYKSVIAEARKRGLNFAVGGGLAAMVYAGQWRNTKDIDLYVPAREREEMIRAVTDLGLDDYYAVQAYDRNWIYRSHKGDTIVDLIWAMANQRSVVDESWLRGPEVEVEGERFRLLAPEEALWSKLYVLQHDRCDWPDALNLLYGVGPEMNWRHLFDRVNRDAPLLHGLLSVFAWICPERARELPSWIWSEVQQSQPAEGTNTELMVERARQLDSRPWFSPSLEDECEGNDK
ncbi:MAG: nucleotidyltransferase [Acidobacteriaceae bacterium]|nr:nucleotidyltransferase [Acidobacteriaceae bacterium]